MGNNKDERFIVNDIKIAAKLNKGASVVKTMEVGQIIREINPLRDAKYYRNGCLFSQYGATRISIFYEILRIT